MPQLFGSIAVLAQVAAHAIDPEGHSQTPDVHTPPAWHA
jgi:hypothetical protein